MVKWCNDEIFAEELHNLGLDVKLNALFEEMKSTGLLDDIEQFQDRVTWLRYEPKPMLLTEEPLFKGAATKIGFFQGAKSAGEKVYEQVMQVYEEALRTVACRRVSTEMVESGSEIEGQAAVPECHPQCTENESQPDGCVASAQVDLKARV